MRILSLALMAGLFFLSFETATQADVREGLASYWPLDIADESFSSTPDLAFGNHLGMNNMDASNLVPGRHGNAFVFNGLDE